MQIKISRLSLSSTFKLKGKWWLANSPDHQVGGTLKYSPDDIRLDLHGTLTPTQAVEISLRHEMETASLVYGQTDAGECTLIEASSMTRDSIPGEVMHSSYSAIYLVIGTHVADAVLSLASLSFACSNLDKFVTPEPCFSVEHHQEGDKIVGVTVSFAFPNPLKLDVPSESFQLSIDRNLLRSESRSRPKISLTARHMITITPSTSHTFEWFSERMWKLCDLLTVLTDEGVHPERVEMTLNGNARPHPIFFRFTSLRREVRRPEGLLLFYCGHIVGQFEGILNSLFSASPTFMSAVHLFIDGLREHGSLEGRFLTLCQALEAVSRATTTSEYMPAKEYEAVASQIVGAIPTTVDSDHRLSLKSRIKFGNEYSLRKRITNAINSLTPDARGCVCSCTKTFVGKIVDSRNHLIHNSEELRDEVMQGADLYWACEQLAMLIRILILREIGLDETLIVKNIRKHPRLMQYERLYHRQADNRDSNCTTV